MINIQRLQNFQPRPDGGAGKPDFRIPQATLGAGQPRLDGMSTTIAFAISCSPITTLVAPCFFKCSISASEWARAMIGSEGKIVDGAPAHRG
jgi:hypothetical protein